MIERKRPAANHIPPTTSMRYFGDLFSTNYLRSKTWINIGGEKRWLMASVVGMAATFNTLAGHRGLNHDCTVFALAHAMRNTQADVPFYESVDDRQAYGIHIGGFKIAPHPIEDFRHHTTKPGDIVMTSQTTAQEMSQGIVDGHYTMVHASTDDKDPRIFVSKFGSDGPAFAHTLEGALYNRPARTIAVVSSLVAVPLP